MLTPFLLGATAAGCATIALFFLRYWRTTLDRLFLCFAWAFAILALDYALLGLWPFSTEWRVSVFAGRLAAFCVILYGIADKNWKRPLR